MRVLFASNYYPPADRGGYEQWCAEVANALAARGHEVRVLTARDGPLSQVTSRGEQVGVDRVLQLEVEAGIASTLLRAGPQRRRLEGENLFHVRGIVAEFQPDVALIWGMWNVPRSVPALLERLLPGRVAYYLCDYWPALPSAWIQQLQVRSRHKLSALPKRLVAWPLLAGLRRGPPISLRFERAYCVSQAVRRALVDAGLPFAQAGIIYGGTQLREFQPRNVRAVHQPGRLRLLCAGRLTPDKGIHTAIQALGLIAPPDRRGISLDIVGRGEADYEALLRAMIRQYSLEDHVTFRGRVGRSEMPELLAQYDSLLLLSEWAEPFARIVLEGMAAGLVVIGTTTGGTPELLRDGENGLAFPPGDAVKLACLVQRLAKDVLLRERLARAARDCVETRFTFDRMVDQMEAVLEEVAPQTNASACAALSR